MGLDSVLLIIKSLVFFPISKMKATNFNNIFYISDVLGCSYATYTKNVIFLKLFRNQLKKHYYKNF